MRASPSVLGDGRRAAARQEDAPAVYRGREAVGAHDEAVLAREARAAHPDEALLLGEGVPRPGLATVGGGEKTPRVPDDHPVLSRHAHVVEAGILEGLHEAELVELLRLLAAALHLPRRAAVRGVEDRRGLSDRPAMCAVGEVHPEEWVLRTALPRLPGLPGVPRVVDRAEVADRPRLGVAHRLHGVEVVLDDEGA